MQSCIITCETAEKLFEKSAELIEGIARDHIESRGFFTLVLSGGKTPAPLYERLAERESGHSIPWEKVFVFWGDERYVPKNHPESNYAMAWSTLLSKIDIPIDQVFPIPTELAPPEEAARSYERTIRDFFNSSSKMDRPGAHMKSKPALKRFTAAPSFDLVLLGLGKDGHTAALYPGSPALGETGRLAAAILAPPGTPVTQRITLTYPAINSAKYVLFLVSGEEKREILKKILAKKPFNRKTCGRAQLAAEPHAGSVGPSVYPAELVRPKKCIYWLTDIQDILE